MQAFVRWRPMSPGESTTGELERSHAQHENSRFSTSIISQLGSSRDRSWKSAGCFSRIFEVNDGNKDVFEAVVAPSLPHVLNGGTCKFFAYGHSGSGKTHTIIGYDYENSDEFGLCLAAAHALCQALEKLNEARASEGRGNDGDRLGIGIRMYEMRKNSAFDLLNGRRECYVREGPDGRVHVRGETEVLEGGKVRVRPVVVRDCWSFEDLRRELQVGLKLRAIGLSTVHDQSSRTHAVVELEVVTKSLLDARDAIIDRESEFVPVAKRATDIYLEENANAYIKTSEGKYVPNPDRPPNQERIDAAEKEKEKFESYMKQAEAHACDVFASHDQRCLGGKLVFVDLAGSEYYHEKATPSTFATKMTPQERQEGRQINTDLLALKEVIRARALNQARIPFRSSPLTMVLREHFSASTDSQSAMILTVSPSFGQFAATMNTLKYGNLVGVAGDEKATNTKG
uniref:Kinesin-like protein n=1 Tax=Coccidioides posadasii RMSCC 3488 TaxID=454284 RepID=A0A0J6FUB2_COCPO|nr:kinesin family protein [Coccidioides posadasii RMSCC 3488]